MIEDFDDEINEFYNDLDNQLNLRDLIEFNDIDIEYTSKELKLDDIKYKKKLVASTYIPIKNKNKLF